MAHNLRTQLAAGGFSPSHQVKTADAEFYRSHEAELVRAKKDGRRRKSDKLEISNAREQCEIAQELAYAWWQNSTHKDEIIQLLYEGNQDILETNDTLIQQKNDLEAQVLQNKAVMKAAVEKLKTNADAEQLGTLQQSCVEQSAIIDKMQATLTNYVRTFAVVLAGAEEATKHAKGEGEWADALLKAERVVTEIVKGKVCGPTTPPPVHPMEMDTVPPPTVPILKTE